MNRPVAQIIRIYLLGLAAAVILWPSILSSGSASIDVASQERIGPIRDRKLILLKRGALDTNQRSDLDTSSRDRDSSLATLGSTSSHTRIVQFGGPIRRKWIAALRATGADIVNYLPNNAYVIRGTRDSLSRVTALHAGEDWNDSRPIQWMGRLTAIDKLAPTFTSEMLRHSTRGDVDVEIELIDSDGSSAAIELINRAVSSINRAPRKFSKFVILSVSVRLERLLEIARLDEVLFVGLASRVELHDERSAQIVAGNLVADRTQPSGPGYLAWLTSKGLDGDPDFIVDITDTGLDRGSTSSALVHPDFLDSNLNSRVAYSINYPEDGSIDDQPGHGTIVASVAGGRGASGLKDAPGYLYGLGVDPMARLGASRIFDARGRLPFQLSFTSVVSSAYSAGARISNNSWGSGSTGYDATAQEYDLLARDAQPSVPGNQEMVLIFSAGNGGPGGRVGSPATAKNVISVAASENYRPEGMDSCNLDGAGGIGPEGADNALDILRFSSGGPTVDLRAKPDLSAPGTHIYGAASRSSRFFGEGLCPGIPVFQPPGQSLYTWSSGTSLAAPHIAGAASLLRRFFISRNVLGSNLPPSPAMTKAYLLNSASYMTGENASESLPGQRQGWGLADLSRAFDTASRVLVDQTQVLTESGQTFEINGSIADRSLPLRVTLAWTDAPGSPVGPAIVNDLDLEITVGGLSVYRGNNFASAHSVEGGQPDSVNNVESIYLPPEAIPEGFQGNFTITVRGANIAGDGLPGNENNLDQDFALVVYNVAPPLPGPPPPDSIPVITGATFAGKVLTITGRDFTALAQVEINGKVIARQFEFNSDASSLRIKLKRRKLNLNAEGDNQIVLIESGRRSQTFLLRL